jgi:hypothetical protein
MLRRLMVAALACALAVGCGVYDRDTTYFGDENDQGPQVASEQPEGYVVKGNISVTTGEKLYHVPGMRDYEDTVIDESRGERWFRTEEEAIAAGWRRAVPK